VRSIFLEFVSIEFPASGSEIRSIARPEPKNSGANEKSKQEMTHGKTAKFRGAAAHSF
jgi:hypothetical protein